MKLTGWDFLNKCLGIEGKPDGVMRPEIEITVYVKVKDFEFLSMAASSETHEQWALPLTNEKEVRTRLRITDNVVHTLTAKKKRANSVGSDEAEQVITKDLFALLKLAATHGYKKTRYNFPIPDTVKAGEDEPLKWEVDVFLSNGGDYSPWVKVDLEMNDLNMIIPPLPFQSSVEALIVSDDPDLSSEEKAMISKLWDKEWQRLDV